MMASSDASLRRYEGIFRAIRRSSTTGLWLCVAATMILAVVYVTSLAAPAAQALAAMGLPRWLAAGIQSAVPLTVLFTLPNLAQFVTIHGDTAAAIEGFNAFAIAELRRREEEGVRVPRFRKADQVQPWVAAHPGIHGAILVRLLVWAGDFEAARAVLANMPIATAADAYERALLAAMVTFVETGHVDIGSARDAMAQVSGEDRDWARLALAFEQARVDHSAGLPWQTPLASARREVAIPRAATIFGRFLSGIRTYATLVVILTAAVMLFALLR